MVDQKKKYQNVKFKKSAIDFKAIKSTNYPSITLEDETIRSAAVSIVCLVTLKIGETII
jgi:uncharacterized membrane protein